MTKPVNILNNYELKAIVMSDKFDCNKFYKYELGKMINLLKEEIEKIHSRDTYTDIVHSHFQLEKKEKRYYENIINEIEKWLEESQKESLIGGCSCDTDSYICGIKDTYKEVLDKLKELKGE